MRLWLVHWLISTWISDSSQGVHPSATFFYPNSTPVQLAAPITPLPFSFSDHATLSTAGAGSSSDWQQGWATSAGPLRHVSEDGTYGRGLSEHSEPPGHQGPASHPTGFPISSIQHFDPANAPFDQDRDPSPLPTQAQSPMFMVPHPVTTSWQHSGQADRPDLTSIQTSVEETRGHITSTDFHLVQTPSTMPQSSQHGALQEEERTASVVDQAPSSRSPNHGGLIFRYNRDLRAISTLPCRPCQSTAHSDGFEPTTGL